MPVTIELTDTAYGPLWKLVTEDGQIEWFSKKLLARQAAARHVSRISREKKRKYETLLNEPQKDD